MSRSLEELLAAHLAQLVRIANRLWQARMKPLNSPLLMLWNRIRQVIFAVLTIIGFVWTNYYLVQFITGFE